MSTSQIHYSSVLPYLLIVITLLIQTVNASSWGNTFSDTDNYSRSNSRQSKSVTPEEWSQSLSEATQGDGIHSRRYSKSMLDDDSWSPTYSQDSPSFSEGAQRTNNRRWSKTITDGEELENNTTSTTALDNNTLEENVVVTSTTEEAAVSYYPSRKDKPSGKVEEENTRTPNGPAGTSVKPTKYHYYPHNQHIYLLPECAVQQVCNAVYVRLNYTQPLCACPSRYREPCSASINADDFHTTELTTDPKGQVLTLVKTCEPVLDMRLCRSPRDWSLLALQNIRTGKSHYLVICRCPDTSVLEGPMSHDQPTYASVPGIRVYGMMCVNRAAAASVSTTSVYHSSTTYRPPPAVTIGPTKRKSRPLRLSRSVRNSRHSYYDYLPEPEFPWHRVTEMITSLQNQESSVHTQGQVVNVHCTVDVCCPPVEA
uniref:Uncharacterized protein n=2 Tax=Cacopsylla melanoneura TaxID=428564 RepID=A0A8D8VTS5_9HEMI